MKTSTKLLIVFFASLPISLLVYNFLLRQEFRKGKFVQHIYHAKTFKNENIKVELPAFKHVVITGGLKIETGSTSAGRGLAETEFDASWRPNVDIKRSKHYGYDVQRKYSEWIETKIKNDTLFVSFYKRKSRKPQQYISFTIYARSLKTVNVSNGSCFLSGSLNKNLEVTGLNASVSISNLISNDLSIKASGTAFYITDNDKIGKFTYSLKNSSSLQFANRSVGIFGKSEGDSTSTISISGSPLEMEKYLVLGRSAVPFNKN